jgi:zinc protease
VSSLAVRLALLTSAIAAVAAPLAAQTAAAPPPVAIAQSGTNGWGVARTDVPADPAIRLGTLPNGMKYAVMANATPKGSASIRLHFAFGSLGEAENERGLAHFIEHMALNETTNVPEGEFIKILERLGLRFGPDTNAVTGFDSTTYMLELPQTDKERVDKALFLMREVAGEAKFTKAAVDRERSVILAERRSRESYQLRGMIDQISFQLPNTPYPKRIPIGAEQVLKTASADTLKALYQRYYRPEFATLVFVGDVDPAAIEAQIKAQFGGWKGVGPAGAPMPRGTIDPARPAAFDTYINPSVPTAINYTIMRPWEDPADTTAERRRALVQALGNGIFNRRLTRLLSQPGTPLLGTGAAGSGWRDAGLTSSITISARDGAWKEALAAADQELRRAVQHGFTEAELKRQVSITATGVKTNAEQAGTRRNEALAASILSTIESEGFVTTPAFRLAHFNMVSPSITLAEVNAEFRKQWTGSAPLIHLKDKRPVATAAIAAAFDDSRKLAVAAPANEDALAFAYDNFGNPGTLVDDKRIEDLGIRTVRFANNVRLNIKKTDFEAGRVRFTVRMAGGLLALPQDKPGLALMMARTSSVAATAKHSMEDLKSLMAGKVVTGGMTVGDDAFTAGGATTAADLATQLKLSAAYLTDPGFRPEAASIWTNSVPAMVKSLNSQPTGVMMSKVQALLANGDWRFGIPDENVLMQRNFDEIRPVMAKLSANAPIEIGIVGDVDEDAAIAAVAQSFGAMPARLPAAPSYSEARKVAFRTDRTPLSLTHTGLADQAMVAAAWPTGDDSDYRREIGLALLGQVVNLMLTETIREQLGASYGVSVSSSMSDNFPGYGVFSVGSVVSPAKIPEVGAAIQAAVKEVRDQPISADLLARARNPSMENIAKSLRENGFWMAYVGEAQGRADRLDRIRQRKAIYESITPQELQKLAQTYLREQQAQTVLILSDKLKKPPVIKLTLPR